MSLVTRIFCLLQLLFGAIGYAQNPGDSSLYYIELFDRQKIYGQLIYLKHPWFGKSHFWVDSTRYAISQVKFYRNHIGYFANVKPLMLFKPDVFAERIIEGKINMYLRWEYRQKLYYYQIGTGALKKAKRRLLKIDLVDHPESMRCIRQMRTLDYVQAGLIVGGIGLIAHSVIYSTAMTGPLIVAGAIIANANLIPHSMKARKREEAIKVYNEK